MEFLYLRLQTKDMQADSQNMVFLGEYQFSEDKMYNFLQESQWMEKLMEQILKGATHTSHQVIEW